jgi:hypothetical protein
MFSRKRLAYILIITLVFSLLFFLFNLDLAFLRSQATNPADQFIPAETVNAQLSGEADADFLVIGTPQTPTETKIRDNLRFTLTQLKIPFREVERVNDDSGSSLRIYVVQDIQNATDLEELAAFITDGGQALFAAGVPTASVYRYLDPVWGILERGNPITTQDVTLNEGFFPYPSLTIPNGYPTVALNVRLNDACDILVEGENAIPLVWAQTYRQGRIAMINGTFLESKSSSGLFVAALNALREHAIIPILGTKTVFLDAIPPLFDGNDDNSFEYYGRSAESFVRDKLWSVLIQKGTLLDLKFTTSFMAIDKLKFDAQNANQQTFSTINRDVLRNGGEITLSGNHVDLSDLSVERIQQTKTFFEGFFPNYRLHAYYPLYGKIDATQLARLRSVYTTLDTLRYLFDGDGITQSSGDYGVEDDLVTFPTTTYGYVAEGKQLYTFVSTLTTYGAISHSFDINALFTVPSSESNWNTLNRSFDALTQTYFAQTRWLKPMTVSSAAQIVRQWDALMISTSTQPDRLELAGTDLVIGQAFLLYSATPIVGIEGATMTPINDRYYLIEALSASIVVHYDVVTDRQGG